MSVPEQINNKDLVTYYASEADWLAARELGIGSSDAAVILGLNPWKSRIQLWGEKTKLIPPDDLTANEAVEWGKILEPIIAGKYEAKVGRRLIDLGRHTIFTHPRYAWMQASLDRIIDPIDVRGRGICEIKSTSERNAGLWEEEAPVLPQVQIQHQFAVTGFTWGSLAVLIGGQQFRYIDVERNDEFISYLIEEEEKFWELVKTGTQPEPDASDSAKEALRKLYPRDTGEVIALPDEIAEWAEKRRVAIVYRDKAAEDIQLAENHIKAAMATATKGLLPNGTGFTLKLQRRGSFTVQATEFRVLREIKNHG
jgi:putative phage-type endonuclease